MSSAFVRNFNGRTPTFAPAKPQGIRPTFVATRRVVAAPTKGAYRPTKLQPRRPVAPTRMPPTARPLTREAERGITAANIPHYDPARIPDLDTLKIVKDLRAPSEAEARGDVQRGDQGTLGPGGAGAVSPGVRRTVVTEKEKLTPGQLALLAALGFLIFGG